MAPKTEKELVPGLQSQLTFFGQVTTLYSSGPQWARPRILILTPSFCEGKGLIQTFPPSPTPQAGSFFQASKPIFPAMSLSVVLGILRAHPLRYRLNISAKLFFA